MTTEPRNATAQIVTDSNTRLSKILIHPENTPLLPIYKLSIKDASTVWHVYTLGYGSLTYP